MKIPGAMSLLALSVSAMMAAGATLAGDPVQSPEDGPPEFTRAFLDDPAVQAAGKAVWQEQCRHCHGKAAYPGKAPKLKPRRYTPDFVFNRVTNGFRGMPSWKEVFSREERMSVVAYVLSRKFSP